MKSIAFLGVLVAVGVSQMQAKTNLSGTWKMDPARSEFGHGPAPDNRTDRITHDDPNFKDTITQTNRQGEITYDMIYTIDGRTCTNTVRGNQVKSVAHWEGNDLVIESKIGMRGETKDRWSLSPDGKTLTIERHMSNLIGSTNQKLIFEKQ